ncbi:MAG: UbiA family prenyltransferase [Thaumarchaeota archaeon]|nr:UbiA family prenyltransferase [Candidatus Calditenuaceae archaeon]MDW8042182.1 UbiA family prenyltransferase [Nitrososphaerota archaeon]
MRKASALIRLTRPPNGLMMFVAVLVGYYVSSGRLPDASTLALSFFTAYCLNGSSMAVNDLVDVEVDRVNAPHRPIPSGAVGRLEAKLLATGLGVIGLSSSALLGTVPVLIAITSYLLALAYNVSLKQTGLLGNSVVSATVAAPFLFGSAVAVGTPDIGSGTLAALAFLSSLGREVVKGIADIEGDSVRGIRTVARVRGVRFASFLGAGAVLAAVVLSPLPYLTGTLGWAYLPLVAVADAGFAFSSYGLVKGLSPGAARRVKSQYLLWMFLALVAFLVGSATR